MKTVFVKISFRFLLSLIMLSIVFAPPISVNANDIVEIDFWNLFTGGDGEFMQQIIEEFNETHPDIKVNALTIEWNNYYPKLLTALVGGQGPDVAIAHISRLSRFVSQGVFYPVDSVLSKLDITLDLDDYKTNILQASSFNEELYALPLDTHPLILYYNKDIIKEAGLTGNDGNVKIPEGKDEFLIFNRKIKEKTGKWGITFEVINRSNTPVRFLYALIKQQGGQYLTADNKEAALGKEALNALKFYDKLFNEYKVAPNNIDYDASMTLFQKGEVAMMINGVWATGSFEGEPNLNFGAIPLPSIFSKPLTWADSHTFVFPVQNNENTEKLKAAITFVNWASKEGFKYWAQAGHIPVRNSVLGSDWYNSMNYRSDYAKAINNVRYVPSTADWLQVEDVSIDVLEALNTGKITPKEALDRLNKEINSVLK